MNNQDLHPRIEERPVHSFKGIVSQRYVLNLSPFSRPDLIFCVSLPSDPQYSRSFGKHAMESIQDVTSDVNNGAMKTPIFNTKLSGFKPVAKKNLEEELKASPAYKRPELHHPTAINPYSHLMTQMRDMGSQQPVSTQDMIANCIYYGHMYHTSLMAVKVS